MSGKRGTKKRCQSTFDNIGSVHMLTCDSEVRNVDL